MAESKSTEKAAGNADTSPESQGDTDTSPESQADTRDTNGAAGTIAERKAQIAESEKDTKVVRRFADGSSEWSTLGELADSHGDAMGGPSSADLNPAFAEAASTHAGSAE